MYAGVPVVILIVFVAWCVLTWMQDRRRRLGPFLCRRDHQGLWRAAFQTDDWPGVDALLSTVCGAFLIPPSFRYRLRPLDDIHEFYRRNMRGSLADSLEYEILMMDLEEEFGLSADVVDDAVWARPCTIGSLARLVAGPRRALVVKPDA